MLPTLCLSSFLGLFQSPQIKRKIEFVLIEGPITLLTAKLEFEVLAMEADRYCLAFLFFLLICISGHHPLK